MINALLKRPIELWNFGGMSGGGGGGGSGAVSYPSYMETTHSGWLTEVQLGINDAKVNNPFIGAVAYNPSTPIAEIEATLDQVENIVGLISTAGDISTLTSQAITAIDLHLMPESHLIAAVKAFSDVMDNEVEVKTLPRFKAGMRDINAVQSSVFVIGTANIEAERARTVGTYAAELYTKQQLARVEVTRSFVEMLQRAKFQEAEVWMNFLRSKIDSMRIKIVALKEQADQNLSIEENEVRWDLDVYQHGANMLAAIGGGTVGHQKKQPSAMQSALGGALAGASVGAQVGGWQGAAIGAGAGALFGLLS